MTKIDRRVARTRARLQQAHLALIVEKGLEAVTVEDICAAADVGRSTFYAHYPNKAALHRDGLAALRRQLLAHQPHATAAHHGPGSVLGFSLPMFEHAREHLGLYRALARGAAGGEVLEEIRRMICDLVRAQLPSAGREPSDGVRREFVVRFLAGAFMSVLTWWLDGGAEASPEQMDANFRAVAAHGLGPLGSDPVGRPV
jgi:AcrR family transcriptional regulator